MAEKTVTALSSIQSTGWDGHELDLGIRGDPLLEAVEALDGRRRARQPFENRGLAAIRHQGLGGPLSGFLGDLAVVAAHEGRVVVAHRLAVELESPVCRP